MLVVPLASTPLLYFFWKRDWSERKTNDYYTIYKVVRDSKRFLEATALLHTLQIDHRRTVETVPLTWHEKNEFAEFQGYSTSVYGDLINRVPGCFEEPYEGDLVAFTKMNGIDASDIIVKAEYSSTCSPAHIVSVDWAKKAIVVAIRGTLHPYDVVTDMKYAMIDWEVDGVNGGIHQGFYETGSNLANSLSKELEQALDKWHEKHEDVKPRLILTGHSLGAASAAVLFLELYKRRCPVLQEFEEVKVFAYGRPAMFTEPLASSDLVKKYVSSFVLEDDLVSSLSHGSVMDFVEGVKRISDVLGDKQEIGGLTRSTELTKMVNEESGCREKLLPPGKVCLCRKEEGMGWVKDEDRAKVFGSIIISANMFLDHMPNRYSQAFDKVTLSDRVRKFLKL